MSRTAIKKILEDNKLPSAHPGLLLTRGAEASQADNGQAKDAGIKRITSIQCDPLYTAAFEGWKKITGDTTRFTTRELKLVQRLYIGVSRDNTLETGISLNHTYGMPLIPGSACKGLARSVAATQLVNDATKWLFGEGGDSGEAGGLIFHDAWWVPKGAPFVHEIITPHHQEYYGSKGKTPATDFDSPIPAPQIATRGSFLFVLEGPPAWTRLGMKLLETGLATNGIGGKKSSGYGLFQPSEH